MKALPLFRTTTLLFLLNQALITTGQQAYLITDGLITTCSGAFLDSGGQGAGGYQNNESHVATICPDVAGDAISLNWLTFNLDLTGPQPFDNMTIYDGNSTAAPTLGTYTGTQLQGLVASSTPLNTTGCLTIEFNSNAAGTGVFAAVISCYTPCDRPVADALIQGVPSNPAKICIGESLTFDGSASTAATGFNIDQYLWDFADGTVDSLSGAIVSHTFNDPGEHLVQLYLLDDNGCASTNRVDLQVLVGTVPDFVGTSGDQQGCVGEQLCLNGLINPVTWSAVPEANFGAGVFLPDDVGNCFTSEIEFTQFAPGQTLMNISQLLSICMDIEHSFLGDLVISIYSPNGQSVIMHQQGGGGTYLGQANDNDAGNPVPGVCWEYCFTPTATNGTLVTNSGTSPLPAGDYESLNPLSALVGSPLNGVWTLEICDLWAADNGFLCGWSVDFDPAIFPSLTTFTPIYGAQCDSSYWTGPGTITSSPDCDQMCVSQAAAGSYDYTYHVVDDFGCTYDTTLTITVDPPPVIDAGPDLQLCLDSVQLDGSVPNGGPPNCVYVLQIDDTFGDGWDGASVDITINGVTTNYTMANGSTMSFNIPVNAGDALSLTYNPGSFESEHSYILFDASGTSIWSDGPSPAPGNVFSTTVNCGGTPYVYQWTPTNGLSDPTVEDPMAFVTTNTTYHLTAWPLGHPICVGTDSMTITIIGVVNPGSDTTVALCETDPAQNMFNLLGGSPDPGGTWADPNGAPHGGTFIPGVDVPGTYIYTVNGVGPCAGAPLTADLTINLDTQPDAGSNGAVSTCPGDPPFGLLGQLAGTPDPGGSWTDPTGNPHSGTMDPAVDPTGIYTYLVTSPGPCPDASATVTVTLNNSVNAGIDGTLDVCSIDPSSGLFGQLGGTPDVGGTWTDPAGSPHSGTFDPAVDAPGPYQYFVAGGGGCPGASATVTVNVTTAPSAGVNANTSTCTTDPAFALFTMLGGTPDPGGSWTDPNGNPHSGNFDPALDPSGGFVYAVSGGTICPSSSATVTVVVSTPPDAGLNGTLNICPDGAATDLFNQLAGTPDAGGSWTSPLGAPFGGMFDPTAHAPGAYVYTVTGVGPCPDAMAQVMVNLLGSPAPDAGPDMIECDLTSLLNATGTWISGSWSGPGWVNFADDTAGTTHVTAAAAGTATLTWSVTTGPGCTSADSLQVTFTEPMTISVTTDDATCNAFCDGSATVNAQGGTGALQYTWAGGVAGPQDIMASSLCADGYTVTATDVNGCSIGANFNILEPVALTIDSMVATSITCADDQDGTIAVHDPDGFVYSVDNGSFIPIDSITQDLSPGTHTVIMQDIFGCQATGTITVNAPPAVVAGFSVVPDTITISQAGLAYLTEHSENAVEYVWQLPNDVTSLEQVPQIDMTDLPAGEYEICLTVSDANNCTDDACNTLIIIDDLQIFIPNAFTPDGNEMNEFFVPVFNYDHVRDYELLIFDRWGQQVFNSSRLGEGWDGTVKGSGLAKQDVYVWRITFRDQFSTETKEQFGHVTLLR